MKTQLKRWLQRGVALAVCVGMCVGGVVARAQSNADGASGELKPLAIVAINGYDDIVKDISFIGSLVGQPQASMQLEMMIQMFTQNQGLVGLDKSRPLGVIILTDGMSFPGAACVPITDLDALLGVLEPLGVETEDQGDGLRHLTFNGKDLFVKVQGNWALVAPMPQMLENLPENPGKFFASLAEQYDIGIRAFVQNIPEPFRQMAVQQFTQSLESSLEQLPDEDDEAYAIRKSVAQAQMQQITRMLEEMDELTFGISLDSDQQRALVDFAFTGAEGTTLANQIAEYSNAKTNFAGFFQPDAAMMLSFASKVTEDEVAQVNQMFDTISQQVMKSIDDEEGIPSAEARDVLKSAMGDFLDALKATVAGGMLDGGAVLNMTPQSLTFVAGGLVGNPAKIESGLKKIAALAELAGEEPECPDIEWNANSHGDISFHTISVPIPESKLQPRQLFGDKLDMVVGIGKQSVYYAMGRDCLDAVKQVIDASRAEPGKAIAPMEATFSLGQIMEVAVAFVDEDDKPMIEMISNMLTNEGTGRDHIRMVVQPIPGGLRYRLEVEEGVLKAIGMGAMAAQAQGVGL